MSRGSGNGTGRVVELPVMGIRARALLPAVVVLIGLAGCTSGLDTSRTPTTNVQPVSASADLAEAVAAWGQGGGGEAAQKVARAGALVETAGDDAALLRSYCTNLDEVTAEAQKYPPIPDAEADRYWSRGLGYARDAARSCLMAASTGEWLYVTAATDAANSCGTEFGKVTARIKAIQAGGR